MSKYSKVETVCNYCNISIKVFLSQFKEGRNYCSKSCLYSKRRNRIKTYCNYCTNPIEIKPYRFNKGMNYCSQSCSTSRKNKEIALTSQEIFFKNISKTEHEKKCWIYKVIGSDGYGRMKIGTKHIRAHRYSYELHCGEIPKGLFVCHSCDTKSCVNPDHLFSGTSLENSQDMVKKGRSYKPIGEKAPSGKLTEEQVYEIRLLLTTGKFTQRMLAKKFSVNPSTITEIKQRKTWAHL